VEVVRCAAEAQHVGQNPEGVALKPRCIPVPIGREVRPLALSGLRYPMAVSSGEPAAGDLIVELTLREAGSATLVFEGPLGFRVLDERDMLEFWNDYSDPNGWLWEVESGGWLDLESTRSGFIDRELIPELREYLVVGDMCVSVICTRPPKLSVASA
jgi:hypothetical protein